MRLVVLGAGGRRARRLLLTGCLILGVLGVGTVEAHAATPSSLAGETFTSRDVRGSTLTGACTGDNEGSFNFSVSGTAAGPFPGTFTESGSFTAGVSGGFLTAFSSTFTITSTAGTVTGSKSLGENGIALCTPGSGPVLVSTVGLTATYSATINGAQRTAGTATVSIEGVLGSGTPVFSENFASAGAVQLTSKEQCRGGGWQSTSSASSPGPRDADGRTAWERSTPTPLPRIHSRPFSGPTDCPPPRSASSGTGSKWCAISTQGARGDEQHHPGHRGEGREDNPGPEIERRVGPRPDGARGASGK